MKKKTFNLVIALLIMAMMRGCTNNTVQTEIKGNEVANQENKII